MFRGSLLSYQFELAEKHPYLNTAGILGGVWVPKDAVANAGLVAEVLEYLASQGGARYVSGGEVRRIVTEKPASSTLYQLGKTLFIVRLYSKRQNEYFLPLKKGQK